MRNRSIRLLNEYELAELFAISVQTVRKMRANELGPPWLKINGSVRYDYDDALRYLASRRQVTSDSMEHEADSAEYLENLRQRGGLERD